MDFRFSQYTLRYHPRISKRPPWEAEFQAHPEHAEEYDTIFGKCQVPGTVIHGHRVAGHALFPEVGR